MSLWSVVRADVTTPDERREGELTQWWGREHQPEYLAFPGFNLAWLLKTLPRASTFGDPGQKYTAVYDIDTIGHFHDALEAGPPWGQWEADIGTWIVGWTRTYRRTLTHQVADDGDGAYWVIVKSDLSLADVDEEDALRRWYDEKHIPEFLAEPGFHRAWRLEVEPSDRDLGPRGHRFWAVYEVDSPEDFDQARQRRTDRGIEPWDGLWSNHLSDWGISYHEIINRLPRGALTAPIAANEDGGEHAAS